MIVENQQKEDMIVYQVEIEDDGSSIKELLRKKLNTSSRLLSKLKRDESILVNDEYKKYHELVKEGDIIKIIMEEEPSGFKGEDLPFNIVYEDVDLIIVNKDTGIVTHPTKSHPEGTVANAAQHYLNKNGIYCKIRFVNRLDMDTSGLLMIAKNPYAHHVLSEQMQRDQVEKKYIAFVEGIIEKDFGIINAPIHRPTFESIKRVVDCKGQPSLTKYKVLKRYSKATMIEVQLITGRTHQIRVHMEDIGHPLIADSLYGTTSNLIDRQALHASYLKLSQPRYGKTVEIIGNLPEDLIELQMKLDS